MNLCSWDCGLNGAYSSFISTDFMYSNPMPTNKIILQKKLTQFDLKNGKKQYIKAGPNKGKPKMKMRRPEKFKYELDVKSILEVMTEHDIIVIERQNPRPGNSASSSFTTGRNYGKILACAELTGAEIVLVNPAQWKKAMGLTDVKLDSIELAEELTDRGFRTAKGRLLHDEAESALIGFWYLKNKGDL